MKKMILLLTVTAFLLCGCSGSTSREPPSRNAVAFSPDQCETISTNNVIFLGDSNTAHLAYYGLVPRDRIWTGKEEYLSLAPDTYRRYIVADGQEMTAADAAARFKPAYILITLGTDGAAALDQAGFRLSFNSLIDSIRAASPDSVIAVQAIFPIRNATVAPVFLNVETVNEKFRTANRWLREIAYERNVLFIDSTAVLCDGRGELRAEYNSDHLDGYHLNRAGLAAMLDNVISALQDHISKGTDNQ